MESGIVGVLRHMASPTEGHAALEIKSLVCYTSPQLRRAYAFFDDFSVIYQF
jgi:hypothetical protein